MLTVVVFTVLLAFDGIIYNACISTVKGPDLAAYAVRILSVGKYRLAETPNMNFGFCLFTGLVVNVSQHPTRQLDVMGTRDGWPQAEKAFPRQCIVTALPRMPLSDLNDPPYTHQCTEKKKRQKAPNQNLERPQVVRGRMCADIDNDADNDKAYGEQWK